MEFCLYICSKCSHRVESDVFTLPSNCDACGASDEEMKVFCTASRFSVVAPWGQEIFASGDKQHTEAWFEQYKDLFPGFRVELKISPAMVWPSISHDKVTLKGLEPSNRQRVLPAWMRR